MPANNELRAEVRRLAGLGLTDRQISAIVDRKPRQIKMYRTVDRSPEAPTVRVEQCPECPGEMRYDKGRALVCGDCGHRVSNHQVRKPEWREKRKLENRRRVPYERMRELVRVGKAKPCHDCGGSWPYYVMHYDHVRAEKSFPLSKAITMAFLTEEALAAEQAKCDVVCANCHALRHAGDYRNGHRGRLNPTPQLVLVDGGKADAA